MVDVGVVCIFLIYRWLRVCVCCDSSQLRIIHWMGYFSKSYPNYIKSCKHYAAWFTWFAKSGICFFVFPTTCHLEEDSAKRKRTDHSCRQREQSCPPDLGWQLETANDHHHGRGVQLELSLVGKTPIPRPVQSGKRVSRFATPSEEVTIRYAIGWTP